jgi:hypothetical protein
VIVTSCLLATAFALGLCQLQQMAKLATTDDLTSTASTMSMYFRDVATSPVGQQFIRTNKRGREVMHRIDRLEAADFTDLTDDHLQARRQQGANLTWEQATLGKGVILEALRRSGIQTIDVPIAHLLPTWQEVSDLYYRGASTCEPVVYGLDRCRRFARRVSDHQAYLATAGLYNTGTNALTYYMRANLHFSNRTARDSVLTQVPWHKHGFVDQRHSHRLEDTGTVSLEHILPVVAVRDPLSWAQSMCQQPYDVKWIGGENGPKTPPSSCPRLVTAHSTEVRLAGVPNRTWSSLLDLWNDWYSSYLNDVDDLDFVLVRHEDLLFCPDQVLEQLQACSGASWVHDRGEDANELDAAHQHGFVYVMDQAKWEHVREYGPQSNRVSAMMKHGHPWRRLRHLEGDDLQAAAAVLNSTLLDLFHYQEPSSMAIPTD